MDRFDSADACLEDLRDDFRTNYDRRLSHTMQNSQSGRESISKDGLMRLRSPASPDLPFSDVVAGAELTIGRDSYEAEVLQANWKRFAEWF